MDVPLCDVRKLATNDESLLASSAEAIVRTDPENEGVTSGRAVDELRTRDEILQLMFWMGTQGLGELVSVAEIIRFVPLSEAAAQAHLAELGALGLVEGGGATAHWRLSVVGEAEARHRFADVLADLVGVLGHGHGHGTSCGADCTDDHEPQR